MGCGVWVEKGRGPPKLPDHRVPAPLVWAGRVAARPWVSLERTSGALACRALPLPAGGLAGGLDKMLAGTDASPSRAPWEDAGDPGPGIHLPEAGTPPEERGWIGWGEPAESV